MIANIWRENFNSWDELDHDRADPQHLAIVEPQRYLSSAALGLSDIAAEAFYEPATIESAFSPSNPDIRLIFFSGGALDFEQRTLQGQWQKSRLLDGDFLLAPGHVPAEVRWNSPTDAPTQTLHVRFTRHILDCLWSDQDLSNVTFRGQTGFRDTLLAELATALWNELRQPSPSGKLYIETIGCTMLAHLLRHYAAGKPKAPQPEAVPGLSGQQWRQVNDYVRAHLGEDLSLERIAAQIKFSPYHFARLFKRTSGETLHHFVTRQRLEQAKHLLKETDIPIAQVALDCGFSSQSYLTRAFKLALGVTPYAYRRDR